MSTTRANLFARLKAQLDKRHNPTVRASGADQRMREHVQALIPKRGQAQGVAGVEMFVEEAERVSAQVLRLGSREAIVEAALKIAHDAGASQLKIAPHPDLKALNWPGEGVSFGIGHGTDLAGLSWAYAGVAETGTVVMRSGHDTPTTLNFLPDVHMVAISSSQIKACYEDVWAMLRADARDGASVMPRTVNWITGPSRTADIEQTLLLGAHGPRKLVILLIDEEDETITAP